MASVAKGALIFMMLGVVTACGPGQEEQAANAEKAKAAQVAFQHELDVVRQARLAELTKPDGWTSLVGLHWIDPGSHYIGSSAGNGIKLSVGPEHLGMIDLAPGRVRFVPDKGAALTLDGQPFTAEAILRADDAPTGPSVIGFDKGKGLATVIKRADRYLLRVKHADAPTRTGFRGIEYWPTAADWRVEGRFVPHEAGKTLEIANIIGTTDAVPNPGAIEFERDGKTFRIEALDEGEETLFLVFADRTSGHGSYPAGRFLDVAKPGTTGTVILDFNQSRNPPCAFTAFATCPLPPPENRLDVAIQAGEKTYAHSAP